MADKKISQLPNLTGASLAEDDEFVIVDTSADETKSITWSELKEGLDADTGFVRITGDTMTGDLTVPNVVVSGNVDGRDVSADGTKLDGIEAGATADQTAGEIETAYESNANTNKFEDLEKTKLTGIEANAKDDQLAVEVPYQVSAPTWARVLVTERGIRRPGPLTVTSVEVLLSP